MTIEELEQALLFIIIGIGIIVISVCGSKYYDDFIKYLEG
jgi:hypothetical protein